MRRHNVIGRLGPGDNDDVAVHEKTSQATEIPLSNTKGILRHGLGHCLDELVKRQVVPSEAGIDLLILAAMVSAADSRISRSSEAQDSWTREIDLYVPVFDTALWDHQKSNIERMLRFLSGDIWRVFFRARHETAATLVPAKTDLLPPDFDCVSLFSGGMDSFIGAIDLLAENRKPLFVSHYWDTSTSSQKICAQRIASVYGDFDKRHVRARIGFKKGLMANVKSETTTRARSFLFIALGAIAASGIQDAGLIVPENGLIALNVPLDPLRLGAWSTRTTHPFYLARWQELLDGLGISAIITNPYRFKTKGKMLMDCASQDLVQKFAYETISCSSIAKARWKKKKPGHCGHCTPCLIRRAAMQEAFGSDQTKYTLDNLTSKPLNSRALQNEHIRSFQLMGARLQEEADIENLLIHKPGPLTDYSADEVREYASVFKTGIEEVERLLKDVVVKPL